RLHRAALQVVAPDGAERRHARGPVASRRSQVAPAMLAAEEALVGARELGRDIIERLRPHAAAAQIDAPPVQRGRGVTLVARVAARARAHEVETGIARDVEHERAVLLARVQGMEDVARGGVVPAHVGVATVTRHDPDAGAALRLPGEHAPATLQVLDAEDDRAE